MIYLLSLRKYTVSFLKTLLFFAVMLLFYFFTLLASLKFRGDGSVFLQALASYGLFIIYSIPFILIISSCFFFAFLGDDKIFNIRLVPIVASFNAILLLIYFLIGMDFMPLPQPVQKYFNPIVKQNYINSIGDYKLLAQPGYGKSLMFYDNAYFISGWSQNNERITAESYAVVGGNGIAPSSYYFSIPGREPVIQIQQIGLSNELFKDYINYLNKLREIFRTTFYEGGLLSTILAVFFMSMGFFCFTSGLAGFLNDRQILVMTDSALIIMAAMLFIILPRFLSIIDLIRFGIRFPLLRITVPGIFAGLSAAMLGYGLIELRDYMNKRQRK